jgi:uncharacterized protein (DUF1330 family)
MTAYTIGHITVKDPKKWEEYRNRVPATLADWGAELIFRGKRVAVLSGEHDHTDTVVIRFPDHEAIMKWHNSAAYQELIPLRTEAADIDMISYEST